MSEQHRESVDLNDMFATITPIEQIVGFQVAEEIYDMLNIREQLIVDLLAAGWNQAEIAKVFLVSQPSISSSVRRIRFKLADSKLKMVLEARVGYQGGE